MDDMDKYGQIWTNMDKYGQIWTNMDKYGRKTVRAEGCTLITMKLLQHYFFLGTSKNLFNMNNIEKKKPK